MSSFSTPPSSDTRTNRWKKRKPTPSNLSSNTSKRHRPDEEDDEEDEDEEPVVEEEDEDDELDASPAADPNASAAALESEVLSDGGIRISDFPPVIRHTVNRPHSSVLALVLADRAELRPVGATNPNPMFLENISHGQLQALSSIPANSPSLAPHDHDRLDGSSSAASAYVCSPPAIMEGKGITRHYGNQLLHVMPMHSDWFSPASVNRLERQVVPHFFSGKSAEHTPEKYMELRNRIVAKYMENQEKRLSVLECQGLVGGVSENDLMRVVRFLDHWGIINYMAPAQNRHKTGGPVLREDVNGEVQIPSAFLKSSIDSLIGFDKPKCRLRPEDVASLCSSVGISDLDSRIRERLAENHCNCCARPLPNMYYQSQKEADIMLCSDCFHDGNFVAGNSSIDFLRVDSTKDFCDLDGDSWTDQETLLLLEALELYSDNWNDIAEHVGTKSKAQCILHFIRLPTEDGLLENIELPRTALSSDVLKERGDRNTYANLNGDADGACLQDNDIDNRIPFVNSGNPVMALVAFLASAVGPRVAAACAHAALAALSKEDHHSEIANGIIQAEGSSHGDRSSSENMHREGGSLGAITNLSHQTEDTVACPLSPESVKAAAKCALSAAATKAKLFADHEEREIQRLTAAIITHQLKRLELKLKQFAEVETLLMKECEQVERTRQRLAAERARMISTRLGPAGATAQPGAATANSSNSIGSNVNQPVMPASAAQANLSSYSNNQPTHPHMPFMPRQQMFSFGPRLPLSVINPSSSAPSPTTMYPSASSNTATYSHPTLRPVSGSKIQM
ncbi:hypothetical protein AAC387_Pa04g2533 [Persea americana]